MRRGSSQVRLTTVGAFLASLFLASLALYFYWTRAGDAFGKLEKLDAASYTESAKSFQGGLYFLEGTMEELLDASSAQGSLVSFAVSSSRGVILIPVLIPQNLGSFNLQKGQALKIKVKGVEKGLLKAEKIEKMS